MIQKILSDRTDLPAGYLDCLKRALPKFHKDTTPIGLGTLKTHTVGIYTEVLAL